MTGKSGKNIAITAGAYIAALTGAGLASGAEICAYFVKYGRISIFGIFIAAGIFALAAYDILTSESRSYPEMCRSLLGSFAARAVNAVSLVFMVCVSVTMCSCSGEFFVTVLQLPRIYGAAAAAVLTATILCLDTGKISAVNGVLGLVIFVGMILVCRHVLLYRLENVSVNLGDNWVTSSVAYGGYNLLTAAPMVFACRSRISSKREAAAAAIVSGLAISVMMVAIWAVIKIFYGKIPLSEIPMLTITARQGTAFSAAYAVLLELAVITTCIGAGEGAVSEISAHIPRKTAVISVCAVSFACAGIPFAALVDKGYRIFGFAAAAMFLPALKNFIKKSKRGENKRNQANFKE